MKVVHLSTSDGGSGAGIAALRIHLSLLNQGVDSSMLVQRKTTDLNEVMASSSLLQKGFNKLKPRIENLTTLKYKKKEPSLFSPAWLKTPGLVRQLNSLKADIIHLHWFNLGFLQIEQLKLLKSPLLWTLHDNWGFTGGCHIMWNCERYKNKCGKCPRLGSQAENDLSRIVWQRKKNVYQVLDKMRIVTPSNWLAEKCKESSLLGMKNTSVVPNPINTGLFIPMNREKQRIRWNLTTTKPIIIFGALAATRDTNKGYELLIKAIQEGNFQSCQIVVFGTDSKVAELEGYDIRYMGKLEEEELVSLYNTADVMVVPSKQEAFGQTIAEPMACGIPVVAFAHSGMLDLIDHQENGYLAKPYNPLDLAEGISWVLQHQNPIELKKLARQKVMRNFESDKVGKAYVKIYKELTKG